jgi:hypothetical protein
MNSDKIKLQLHLWLIIEYLVIKVFGGNRARNFDYNRTQFKFEFALSKVLAVKDKCLPKWMSLIKN